MLIKSPARLHGKFLRYYFNSSLSSEDYSHMLGVSLRFEKRCYFGVWTVGRMVRNISSMFFLKSNSFNQYTLRCRRLDASFWELHIKLLNSEGEPTWSQLEERVERRSTCRRQTAARPHKKNSSCRIYEGEWFLSGQSQSPVRPVLDQTPEEIQTVSVNYVQLFNHKVI